MRLIKNSGNDRVADELRACIAPDSNLDIATPSFSLFAFAEVRTLLEKLNRCRLVIPTAAGTDLCMLGSESDRPLGAERFYLKMLDMEARGTKTLDNHQNFAKAFKVRDFHALMGDQRANHARLKTAVEFGRSEMSEGSELNQSVLRAVLYAVMELTQNMDGNEVMAHLILNIPNYYGDMTQRELAVELADYLAKHLDALHPEEGSSARVLRELVKNQRLG